MTFFGGRIFVELFVFKFHVSQRSVCNNIRRFDRISLFMVPGSTVVVEVTLFVVPCSESLHISLIVDYQVTIRWDIWIDFTGLHYNLVQVTCAVPSTPWRSGLAVVGTGSSVKLSCADSSISVLSTRMLLSTCS